MFICNFKKFVYNDQFEFNNIIFMIENITKNTCPIKIEFVICYTLA